MTTELATTGLDESEQQFVYNIEVLGMSQVRAAQLAGVASPSLAVKKPEIIDAREKLRSMVRTRAQLTKEDVIDGVRKAIDQADLLADPMAQIAGWREIAKMLGYDAPREVKVTVSHEVSTRRRQIAQLDDADLVELLEAEDVVDGDFYELDGN